MITHVSTVLSASAKRIQSAGFGLLLVLVPLSAIAATTMGPSGEEAPQAAAVAATGNGAAGDITAGVTLEITKDQCSRSFVIVEDTSTSPPKKLSVAKGENVVFKPVSPRFTWYCATARAGQSGESTHERTRCASGTDLVRISRASTGREITWHCMD